MREYVRKRCSGIVIEMLHNHYKEHHRVTLQRTISYFIYSERVNGNCTERSGVTQRVKQRQDCLTFRQSCDGIWLNRYPVSWRQMHLTHISLQTWTTNAILEK